MIDKQTVNALYYWTRVAPMLEGDPLEGGSLGGDPLEGGGLVVLAKMRACKVGHVIDKQTVNALYYWTRAAPMLEG